MSDIAICVEGLSKLYRIGTRYRYRTLRETLTNTVTAPLRWFHANGSSTGARKSEAGTLWALKNVSFEVRRGEVTGIIGRNGAGKSTLLKILSRITEPTEGHAEIHGRVGSLLEVGTGFHPELTGRENIFLNGAILGMKKTEIKRKFDEIVEFAEVNKFIDTPVKHYSSGMYVRLAFSVAGHLEPDILVVDEVLAVGDAGFQRKCLGKLSEVAKGGRTVLFVTHNMPSVRSLCTRALLIEEGTIAFEGDPVATVSKYLSLADKSNDGNCSEVAWRLNDPNAPSCEELRINRVRLASLNDEPKSILDGDHAFHVEICYEVAKKLNGARFNLHFVTSDGEAAFSTTDHNRRRQPELPGNYKAVCTVPAGLLNTRTYVIELSCDIPGVRILIPRRRYLTFAIASSGSHGSDFPEVWPGIVCPTLEWRVDPLPLGDNVVRPRISASGYPGSE